MAKLAGVSTKMLRHYDSIGLFSPENVNGENGYRQYSIEQLHKLTWITTLKALDFSLDEIRKLLSNETESTHFLTALAEKRMALDHLFKQTLIKSLQIDYLLDHIKREGFHMNQTIDISKMNESNLLAIKKGMPNMDMLLEKAYQMMDSTLSGDAYGLFRIDLKQFKAFNDVDGYEVGDKVIVTLYKILETSLEKFELGFSVARAGGDEFVIFAKGQVETLKALASEVKSAVHNIDYQNLGCHKPIDIYLSAVISHSINREQIRTIIDDTQSLLLKAHQDLYDGGKGICIVEQE